MKASNDPNVDPIETRVLRYTLPIAMVGIAAALTFIGWLLTL